VPVPGSNEPGAATWGTGSGVLLTMAGAENFEVLFAGSVAVAVTKLAPSGGGGARKVNAAKPAPSVLTVWVPRKKRPDGPFAMLAKNSIVNVVFGLLVRVPFT